MYQDQDVLSLVASFYCFRFVVPVSVIFIIEATVHAKQTFQAHEISCLEADLSHLEVLNNQLGSKLQLQIWVWPQTEHRLRN